MKQARDVLVGHDLVHHLHTKFRSVDTTLAWRKFRCSAMVKEDMVYVTTWTTDEDIMILNPSRVFASDELLVDS